ncbi:MAG: AAA family ATPase [Ignavibacteriaceae bacterium]|nr:AAA family ATPase [Ignavibacteriaceae bacterium]
MKIYFREKTLAKLNQIASLVSGHANFTLVIGRRKVGKTTIIKQFLRQNSGAYFTISNKSSALQLKDISTYLKSFAMVDSYIPSFESWRDFFDFLFHLSRTKPINVVIDEFQNFELIDPNAYNDLRIAWDMNADNSSLNLMVITSNADFVKRSFGIDVESRRMKELEDSERKGTSTKGVGIKSIALEGIQNEIVRIDPFKLAEVYQICKMNNSTLTKNQILILYIIFGGLPKYYFLLERYRLWDTDINTILKELVFGEFAPLAFELKELLVNDFSRGNKIYLSILQSIANGENRMTEIARSVNIPVTNLTKYLFELEKKKRLIYREIPINTLEDSKSKFGRYFIFSNFDNFWFRFIQPDIINFEIGEYDLMLEGIMSKLGDYLNERIITLVREAFREYSTKSQIIKNIFPYRMSNVGALYNRKEGVELIVESEESQKVLLGNMITKEGTVSVNDLTKATSLLNKFKTNYTGWGYVFILIIKGHPDDEAQKFARENNIRLVDLNLLIDVVMGESGAEPPAFIEVNS